LTILGVALGVAVLLAVLVTNAGISSGADRVVERRLGTADLRVSAFEERGLDEASRAAIAGVPGVTTAAPSIDRDTYLLPTLGSGLEEPADPVRVLGVDPTTWSAIHGLEVLDGRPIVAGQHETALVSPALATAIGAGVDDKLTLLGDASLGPFPVTIGGILDPRSLGRAERLVILPLDAAQRLFATDGVDAIDVAIDPSVPTAQVVAGIEGGLVSRPYVLATASELAASIRAATAEFRMLAGMVAVVVLFVAGFLIFNTLSMTVTERLSEVALLRAAGATAGQIHRIVLAIAVLIGTAGAIAGVMIGLGLAVLVGWYVRTIEGVPLDDIAIDPVTILAAALIGFATTVVSGIEPALRAARVRPVEALRVGRDPIVGERARLRWLIVVFGVVAVAAVLLAPADAGPGGIARSLAVYALLLLAALLVPLLLAPLGRLVGLVLRPVARAEERLSRGSIARDRSRAALAAGALGVGLAMVVALATVADGARAAGAAWLDDVVPGDLVVSSIRPIAPDEGIDTELRDVPGVVRVTPFATFDVAHRGQRLAAVGTTGADLAADGRLRFLEGDREEALAAIDAGGATILPRSVAGPLGLRVGDALESMTADGPLALTVVGIVERSMPGSTGEAVIVGFGDALERFGATGADLFAIRFADPAADGPRAALAEIALGYALTPTPVAEVQSEIGDALGRMLGLFDAVALLAVLVAGLGVADTFAMSVIERVPEIGVLRATGMTRRQVGRMVIVEAIMLGGVGAIVGCLAGIVVGLATIVLGGSRLPAAPLPSPSILVAVVVIGLAVPVIAALYPARTAGRIPIVRAVAFR
jgi:putative ABC transport system permease protein